MGGSCHQTAAKQRKSSQTQRIATDTNVPLRKGSCWRYLALPPGVCGVLLRVVEVSHGCFVFGFSGRGRRGRGRGGFPLRSSRRDARNSGEEGEVDLHQEVLQASAGYGGALLVAAVRNQGVEFVLPPTLRALCRVSSARLAGVDHNGPVLGGPAWPVSSSFGRGALPRRGVCADLGNVPRRSSGDLGFRF